MGKYLVKCDECKRTIKTTDDIRESYAGISQCVVCKERHKRELDWQKRKLKMLKK